MATTRKGLGRILVTLLLVVGFVLGPVSGRLVAADAVARGCHGMAASAHDHPDAHGHGHHAATAGTVPDDAAGGFDLPRVAAGLACLVHCSWLPVPVSFAAPGHLPLVIEPRSPSAEPVSFDVEPAVPPPRFETIDAI